MATKKKKPTKKQAANDIAGARRTLRALRRWAVRKQKEITRDLRVAAKAAKVALAGLKKKRASFRDVERVERHLTYFDDSPTTKRDAKEALKRNAARPKKPKVSTDRDVNLAFAAEVLRVARTDKVKKFHGDRAYIASVFDAHKGPWTTGTLPVSLALFKQLLIEAHRAGRLRLTRADMVGAMPADLVQRSEAEYMGATFHFVVIE